MLKRNKPLARSTKPIARSPVRRRRPGKPRRGRVVNDEFLAYVGSLPCLVHGRGCPGRVTVHHVKETPGAQKNDERTVPLCEELHLHDFGPHCVERLGKVGFQEFWGVIFDAAIEREQADFVAGGGILKGSYGHRERFAVGFGDF